MKNFIDNLSIKKKLLGGFGLVLILLLLVTVSSMTTILNSSEGFNEYRTSALSSVMVGRIQANLLEGRIHVKNYLLEQNSSEIENFEERIENMKKFAAEAKKLINEKTQIIIISQIQNNIKKYENAFNDLVAINEQIKVNISEIGENEVQANKEALIQKRNDIVDNTLDKIGPEISAEIEDLKLSLKSKQDEIGPAMAKSNKQGIWIASIFGITAIVLGLFLAVMISNKITNSISKIRLMIKELSKGKLDNRLMLNSRDEIGEMARELNTLSDNLNQIKLAMNNIAVGKLDVSIDLLDKEDELNPSLIEMVGVLRSLINETMEMTKEAKAGNLMNKGDLDKFHGAYKEIVRGINDIMDEILLPVRKSSEALQIMATGDLTVRINEEFRGDFNIIKNNINGLGKSLSELLRDVAEGVVSTASASSQISSSSEEMAAGAQEQSAQTTEIASAVEEMTSTILETSKNANNAAQYSKEAGEKADAGSKQLYQSKLGIERITKSAEKTGMIIRSLTKKTDGIGEIANVINEIADQTNLLALNAAIEAARAGEQGRGFAVVADEVRKLAERTAKATKEISDTIKEVQTEAKEADNSMIEAGEAVGDGVKTNEELEKVFNEILQGTQRVKLEIEQVATASEEQSSAAEQISKNIEGISSVTQQSAAGTEQVARATEDLNRLTERLQTLTSKFKIDAKLNNNRYEKEEMDYSIN